jgi:ribonuclease HII
MPSPDFTYELAAMALGHSVCGIDEAGRGPWAGPVVAAAVILDPHNIPAGLNDSKKLSPARRESLYAQIIQSSRYGMGLCTAAEIDQLNILQATFCAMQRAAAIIRPGFALVDGTGRPALDCPVKAIIGGDAKSLSIAAASILAKVARDRMMVDFDRQFPGYGFAAHKGYGTAAHAAALAKYGPCTEHRHSFAPVKAARLKAG